MSNGQVVLLSVVLEANDDGYLASVPGMQGAFAEGDTVEEAVFNCVEVVKLILAYRAERSDSPILIEKSFKHRTNALVIMLHQ